jgi:hypothetical protein
MGLLMPRENLADPQTLMYRYGDKFYQVSHTGAVFWVDIEHGGKHRSVPARDIETWSAVTEMTGQSFCSTCGGLQNLAESVHERVTEEDVETIAISYWSLAATPFVGGGNILAYGVGGIGAISGGLSAYAGGGDWHKIAKSGAVGLVLSTGIGRLDLKLGGGSTSVLDDVGNVAKLWAVGFSSNSVGQLLTDEIDAYDPHRAAVAGLATAAMAPFVDFGAVAFGLVGSAYQLITDFLYEGAHHEEDVAKNSDS